MNRWTSTAAVSLAVAAAFFLSVQTRTRADDAPPKSDDGPPPKQPAEPEKPKEKSLLEKLGDDLMKEEDDSLLGGAKPGQKQADKMDRAVKGMRNAGEQLDGGKTADETQKIQKQVIKDLEDIINQLENPPPSQGGGGGGGGGGSNNSKSGGGGGGSSSRRKQGGGGSSLRLNRPQGSGGQKRGSASKQNGQQEDEEAGGTTAENASDSSKQTQAARKAAEEEARRKKLEMDIWGHLPPHMREELLNTYGERMLPKYEQMVKQFYEALSTQGDAKKK